MNQMDENEEQIDKSPGISGEIKDKRILNLLPHQYKKGQSGNPSGKPKGTISMKTYVKNRLASMTEEEREIYLEGIDKKIIWEMAEGKAKQDLEVDARITGPSAIKLDE